MLPNNDGLQTDPGSNEIVRASGWLGFGSFLTGYSQGAIAGPLDHTIPGTSRAQLLGTEVVASIGDVAISFGQEERWWGTGYFGSLSQGPNAKPFYALTIQNIHPNHLPLFFRYLGPSRREGFLGQLDADRASSQHPWIAGFTLAFKPLPWFEFGVTRAIIFGGRGNDHYGFSGFLGRLTGIDTGDPANGQTKSRAGLFIRFKVRKLRDLEVYQEFVGSDNATNEIPGIGHVLPFINVSFQGGFYLPRLTEDGLTDCRFEYSINSGGYSIQSGQSLYFTYDNTMFGHPIGPNASEVDVQFGRWFDKRYKGSMDLFYTEQAPSLYEGNFRFLFAPGSPFYPYSPLGKEHSGGVAFDMFRLPEVARWSSSGPGALFDGKARVAFEYVDDMNYSGPNSFRALATLSIGLTPLIKSFQMH